MLYHNINQIIAKYDVFFLDIFGLIHDGSYLYDGAMDMLQNIKKAEKKAIFVSNAPRNSFETAKRLAKFNITEELYDVVYTPGQIFYDDCKNQTYSGTTGKYFAFGNQGDIGLIDGIAGFTRTEDITNADCILSFGIFETDEKNSQITELLKIAVDKKLPMLCLNPDKIVKKQGGKVEELCGGYIANIYLDLGGQVSYYGKPYQEFYQKIWEKIGKPNKKSILAMGDSFETDIKGACNFDIDSALVLTGVHNNLLDNITGLEEEIRENSAKPTYILKNLIA